MNCCTRDVPYKELPVNVYRTAASTVSDFVLKIVVAGDSGVGKTCMANRVVTGSYIEGLTPTIGVDYQSFNLHVNARDVKLLLWDTAGQERYAAITDSYFRDVHVLMLAYDTGNAHSYTSLTEWMRRAKVHSDTFEVIVVGCKIDTAETAVEYDAERLTKDIGVHTHVCVSAKTTEGFPTLLRHLETAVQRVLLRRMQQREGSAVFVQ